MLLILGRVLAQSNSPRPLEAINIQHSAISSDVIQPLTGLSLGQPIDKAAIEAACQRLSDTALFSNVQYRYAPGPKHGYILTLDLQDETDLTPAIVDIPFVDEAEVWQWLTSRYPTLQHKIPKADSGQEFLAKEIGAHVAAALDGEKVVTRQESDLGLRSNVTLFQPETLPQIAALEFSGAQELSSAQIAAIIRDTMKTSGFTDRNFRVYLEDAVRRIYEEHGMYRVQFPKVTAARAGKSAVNVKADVVEGPQFKLGTVHVTGGADVPVDAMLKAAQFKPGAVANWRDIQRSLDAMKKPPLRAGYKDATFKTQRVLNDEQKVLNLEIPVMLGPQYRFGQVSFVGLAADADARAHQMWKMKAGDIYDSYYVYDFASEFLSGLRSKSVGMEGKEQSDAAHVVNLTVTFTTRAK